MHSPDRKIATIKTIGPFEEKLDIPIGFSDYNYLYRDVVMHGKYHLQGSFYYAKIAFSCARTILKKLSEEKKIVPEWIIGELSEKKGFEHIVSSLKLIEIAYENKNPEELITNTITILDSFLSLDVDLKLKKKLSGKLNSLQEDKAKLEQYGVSKDIVLALNNFRIIRNEKIVHKDLPIKYSLPFIIAASFVYLSLFSIETLLLNGEIIKD